VRVLSGPGLPVQLLRRRCKPAFAKRRRFPHFASAAIFQPVNPFRAFITSATS
jgi:hypothetical protein